MRFPYDRQYETGLVIVVVRNPLDVLVSFFMQISTMSHNKTMEQSVLEFDEWYTHVDQDSKLWPRWMNHWVEKARNKEVPVFFARFEDLVNSPKEILSEIFSFIL